MVTLIRNIIQKNIFLFLKIRFVYIKKKLETKNMTRRRRC